MRAHGIVNEKDRERAFEEHRQELQGRLPKGPFEFDNGAVADDDPPVVKRFKLAVARDSKYAMASAPYLQVFGLSQSLRSIYDGGGQIADGSKDK